MRLFTVGAVVLLALAGCGDGEKFQRGADRAVTTSPQAFVFGGVSVGETRTQEVIVTHVGESGTLELGQAELLEASGDLTVAGPEPRDLQPGESAVVIVTYAPTDGSYDQGIVRILHNVPEQPPLDIPIQTVLQMPLIRSQPALVEFGNVSAGTVAIRPVELTNVGTLATTIEAVGLDVEFGAPFERSDTVELPMTLAPGASVALEVTYSPANTGTDEVHQGRLRLVTDHPGTNNQFVLVRGRARHPQLVVKPAVVNFGWVTVGDKALSDVTLQNSGTDPVEVSSLALVEASDALTLLGAPDPPVEIQPGETLTISVRFAPEAAADSGSLGRLVIETNDYVKQKREVTLLGAGAQPALAFVPAELLDFGVVAIGHQHSRVARVVNLGAVPLTLDGAWIEEEGLEWGFSVLAAPVFPVVMAPGGGVAEIVLAYNNPDYDDELLLGQLVVASDDPVQPTAALTLRTRTSPLPLCLPRFEPTVLEFGTVGPGSQAELTVTMLNDGSMPCTYQTATFLDCEQPSGLCQPILGASDAFTLGSDPPPTGRLVFFGDSLDIPVRYQPAGEIGEHAGITVATLLSGPGSGPASLYVSPLGGLPPTLHGQVGSAGVIVKPNDLTFPLTTVGCGGQPVSVDVMRIGAQPIDLASIDLSACDGTVLLGDVPALPVPLFQTADAAVPMLVQFVPAKEGFAECTLTLNPDLETAGAGTLTVRGTGTNEPLRTDFFQQSPEFEVDILFVIDDSGSMKDEQTALIAGFDGFIAQAAVWDVQYQIGVVTTDLDFAAGVMEGPSPYVDNATAEGFKLNANVGTKGSGNEQGLLAAWYALQPEKLVPFGLNGGFLRKGSLLAIIWVSDEEDHSGAPQGLGDVSLYVDYFKSLKPEGRVKGYAIVGDPSDPLTGAPGGCNGGEEKGPFGGPKQGAEAGDRYIEAAALLDGFWFSICAFGAEVDGQPPLLDQIGKDAFQPISSFALQEVPTPDSITVMVNDELCGVGWVWSEAENTIVFDQAIPDCFPGPNASISVTYEPVCWPPVGQ